MKYVVCHSGGYSSATCALSVANLYGKDNVVLLNHDITARVEREDTKRFKQEVADYLEIPITYANHPDWENKTPIQIIKDIGYFTDRKYKQVLCTHRLKTEPFYKWMKENDPNKENIYVYGMDKNEPSRITTRSQRMGLLGYKTSFPMLWGDLMIVTPESVGIDAPSSYDRYKHSNCTGCLKAGFQHWYIVYIEDREMFDEVADYELELNFSLRKNKTGSIFLDDKRELFDAMMKAGVEPTEHIHHRRFWIAAKKKVNQYEAEMVNLSDCDSTVCLDCSA